MQAMLNCKRISRYEPITVKAGDRLTFAYANSGCRAYLAVAGGFQVPSSYGSYSTNLRCGFGGFYGRALKSGDEIPFHQAEGLKKWRRLSDKWIKEEKDYIEQKEDIIRVVMGPQNAAFTKKGIHTFLSESYEISNESDRMGCRLLGDKIEAKHGYDIISDATAMGTIQVTNKGLPIVMLSDRQTTGGYAKIATIIQSDLPRLVQKKPGDKVKFRRISVDAARRIYKKEQKRINEWISKEG